MLLLPAMLLVAGAATDSCTPLDRGAFAREVAAAVQQELGLAPGEVRVEEDRFRLHAKGGGHECMLNLHNLADEVCASAVSDRPGVVRRFVRIARTACGKGSALPGSYAAARASLLPVVRSRIYLESMTADLAGADGKKPPRVAGEPLGEHLHVALVADLPDSMIYLRVEDLEGWGVTWKAAYADALANLRARSREPLVEISPGLWSGAWGDAYGPSRLLLADTLRALVRQGDVVVTVPSQRALFACSSEDARALEALARHTEEAAQEARPVSALPLRVSAAGVSVFTPPPAHPARRAMERLRIQEMAAVYAQDQQALDARNEKAGLDVFVAGYRAMQRQDGEVFSVGVLTLGIPTWLPRTEVVGIVDPGREPPVVKMVTFERAMELLGRRAVLRPGYPPRWEVTTFPTAAEVARLPTAPGF